MGDAEEDSAAGRFFPSCGVPARSQPTPDGRAPAAGLLVLEAGAPGGRPVAKDCPASALAEPPLGDRQWSPRQRAAPVRKFIPAAFALALTVLLLNAAVDHLGAPRDFRCRFWRAVLAFLVRPCARRR